MFCHNCGSEIKDDVKLILVGDYNQLPSVGLGNILKDLIDSDIVDKIELDLLYRQDEASYIPVLADDIKHNNLDIENFTDKDGIKLGELESEFVDLNGWQAESDASTMAQYQEIMADKQRMNRAIKVANKKAADLTKRAQAMQSVARTKPNPRTSGRKR